MVAMSMGLSKHGSSSMQRQNVQWQQAGSCLQRTDNERPGRSASQQEHSS